MFRRHFFRRFSLYAIAPIDATLRLLRLRCCLRCRHVAADFIIFAAICCCAWLFIARARRAARRYEAYALLRVRYAIYAAFSMRQALRLRFSLFSLLFAAGYAAFYAAMPLCCRIISIFRCHAATDFSPLFHYTPFTLMLQRHYAMLDAIAVGC